MTISHAIHQPRSFTIAPAECWLQTIEEIAVPKPAVPICHTALQAAREGRPLFVVELILRPEEGKPPMELPYLDRAAAECMAKIQGTPVAEFTAMEVRAAVGALAGA